MEAVPYPAVSPTGPPRPGSKERCGSIVTMLQITEAGRKAITDQPSAILRTAPGKKWQTPSYERHRLDRANALDREKACDRDRSA
jgi:hypothetical protein